MRTPVLVVHVTAGVAGLVLGPLALRAALQGSGRGIASASYPWLVLAVCTSAAALTAFDWSGLWWFVPIAAGSYAFALRAQLAVRWRQKGWRATQVRGLGGSYIALWTAVFVVSAYGVPVLWLIPVALGIPLIERNSHRRRADTR